MSWVFPPTHGGCGGAIPLQPQVCREAPSCRVSTAHTGTSQGQSFPWPHRNGSKSSWLPNSRARKGLSNCQDASQSLCDGDTLKSLVPQLLCLGPKP